jgi:hypothetical protein
MFAALATLVFGASLWLAVILSVRTLQESGGKIAAALQGEHSARFVACSPAARVRLSAEAPADLRQPLRPASILRAAA